MLLTAVRGDLLAPVRRLAGMAQDLGGIRGGWRFAEGLPRTVGRVIRPGPPSLGGPESPYRRWAWAHADLAEINAIRAKVGGTVNDIILAAVTSAFRGLLESRGELTADSVISSLVPVSVRADTEHGVMTNRVSAVIVNLPAGEPDPLRRLSLLRRQTDELKRTHQAAAGDMLIELAGLAPALLPELSRAVMALARPFVQTVVTNIPGPQFPLYVLGRRAVAVYPYVPIASGVQISVGIFSYLGRLNFGLTGDFDTAPDLDLLTSGLRTGLDELAAFTHQRAR